MKKFLVLYMAPAEGMAEMMKNSTPEQQKEGTAAWFAWLDAHKADLVDQGAPVGRNMRVTPEGTSDASNDVGGYGIIQAESQEAAAKILADSPNFSVPGAYIEVLPIVDITANA